MLHSLTDAAQTSGGAWLPEFLNFTTAHHAAVDFVSTHAYPTQLDNGLDLNAMRQLIGEARQQVELLVVVVVVVSALRELTTAAGAIHNQVPSSMPFVVSEYNSGLFSLGSWYYWSNNDSPFASAYVAHTVPQISAFNVSGQDAPCLPWAWLTNC